MPALDPDPALAEIARMVSNGTWTLVVGALVGMEREPIESMVFTILTPRTAVQGFGADVSVGRRLSAVGAAYPRSRVIAAFCRLRLPHLAIRLAANAPAPGEFLVIFEGADAWKLATGPVSELPRTSDVERAGQLAHLDAQGQCAGDLCSTYRAGSA